MKIDKICEANLVVKNPNQGQYENRLLKLILLLCLPDWSEGPSLVALINLGNSDKPLLSQVLA